MSTNPDTRDTQAIIKAAREHAAPVTIDPTKPEIQVFVVPEGSHLDQVMPNDKFLTQPRRLKGSVVVDDVASFKAYVTEFYGELSTTAWVDPAQHRVTAILNDAHADESAWRDHRATLQLVKTPEWKRWRQTDGSLMNQETFARHIEMSEVDIANPDAGTLLEIAQTFYASTKADFRSGTRLQDGQVQFSYVEETNATAGRNGELDIPAKFELLIAPFHGEKPVTITALLRYRIRDGKLAIGYELVRPDDIERAVMDLIAESLRGDIARVYLGSPAA